MGIDNSAILVYGWTFDYEELQVMQKYIQSKKGETKNEEEEYLDEVEDVLATFLDSEPVVVGNASPYYDCGYDDRTYYISFRIEDMSHEELYNLFKLHHESGISAYPLLKELGIDTLPTFCALPHIW